MGPDGGGWKGSDEPIWPGGPWHTYDPMRQAGPPIGACGYGPAPAWGAPFPPPRPAVGAHRTYAFLIVAGALGAVVLLVALVSVAVSFVRTEIRRYVVPSNGFVQPVPLALGPLRLPAHAVHHDRRSKRGMDGFCERGLVRIGG